MSVSHKRVPSLVTPAGSNDHTFSLESKAPNAETRAAIEDSRAMMKAHVARYPSAETLFDTLEEAGRK